MTQDHLEAFNIEAVVNCTSDQPCFDGWEGVQERLVVNDWFNRALTAPRVYEELIELVKRTMGKRTLLVCEHGAHRSTAFACLFMVLNGSPILPTTHDLSFPTSDLLLTSNH